MQSDEAVLIEKFTRLGVDDPRAAARSEIAEGIPQWRTPGWNDSCG